MEPQERPWGRYSISFELPVATVSFSCLSNTQLQALSRDYHNFLSGPHTDKRQKVHECRAYRLNHALTNSPASLSQANLYTPIKLRRKDRINISGFNFEAQIQIGEKPQPSFLGVFFEDELAHPTVIENYLRTFSAHQALALGGVVLHSAGLVIEGLAYIFSGRSNAGKTTLARKSYKNGAWILSDDINLVMPDEHGYRAHAVPFTGEFGRTLQHEGGRNSYPLAGIILLEQSDRLEASAVKASDAVARLLTACPFTNVDPEESEALFDVLTALVSEVPVVRLRSRLEDGVEDIMNHIKRELPNASQIQ